MTVLCQRTAKKHIFRQLNNISRTIVNGLYYTFYKRLITFQLHFDGCLVCLKVYVLSNVYFKLFYNLVYTYYYFYLFAKYNYNFIYFIEMKYQLFRKFQIIQMFKIAFRKTQKVVIFCLRKILTVILFLYNLFTCLPYCQ